MAGQTNVSWDTLGIEYRSLLLIDHFVSSLEAANVNPSGTIVLLLWEHLTALQRFRSHDCR